MANLYPFRGKQKNNEEVLVSKLGHLAVDEDPFARYALFEAMYNSNNLYQEIQRSSSVAGEWLETLMSIATPCNRSVEFYANRLLMGARVSTTDAALGNAINVFLRDSNFNGIKDNYSRELAKLGDLFVKVNVSTDINNRVNRVFMERIESKHVSKVTTDARGIVQEIRIDIAQGDGKWYTEYWYVDKGYGYTSIWENHPYGKEADLEQLGEPTYYATLAEYGISFIPIVYIKFTSKDNKRAENAFVHAISKIHEANRERSRLAELMFAFNTAIWTAYGTGATKDGGFLGDPEVKFIKSPEGQVIQYVRNVDEWKSNIPPLDYQAHLAMFKDMRDELTYDLPEIKINSIDQSQISGEAIENLLGESIHRANTARSNLVHGIQRINMMGITIGQFYGLFDRSLGNYIEDDFRHDIICNPVIPISLSKQAVMIQQFTSGGMSLKMAMELCGFSETQIEKEMQNQAEKEASLANQFLLNPAFSKDTNVGG